MSARQIAEAIRKSPEQAFEFAGQISVFDAAKVAGFLEVSANEVYISCGAAETIRVSVPVTIPIRRTPMGQRA